MLPWLFKRYILRRRDLPEPEFYTWAYQAQTQP